MVGKVFISLFLFSFLFHSYKNPAARITGIQNMFSEVTILTYWFETAVKLEGLKWVSKHAVKKYLWRTLDGQRVVLHSWGKACWAPGFSLGLGVGYVTPVCTSENIQTPSRRLAKKEIQPAQDIAPKCLHQLKPSSRLAWRSSSCSVPCKIKYCQL